MVNVIEFGALFVAVVFGMAWSLGRFNKRDQEREAQTEKRAGKC